MLQFLYLRKYELTLIATIVRFLEQIYVIGKQFNNLLPTSQVYIIHAILNKE